MLCTFPNNLHKYVVTSMQQHRNRVLLHLCCVYFLLLDGAFPYKTLAVGRYAKTKKHIRT